MVVGQRFTAFWPLGSRANLLYDYYFLVQAFGWSYEQIYNMPCSLRHSTVKMQEEIVRIREVNSSVRPGGTWYQRSQRGQGR